MDFIRSIWRIKPVNVITILLRGLQLSDISLGYSLEIRPNAYIRTEFPTNDPT